MLKVWVLLVCLISATNGLADDLFEPAAPFTRITRDQGLSHFTVRAVIEDETGFLWIATHGGLDRFDGHEFRHFRHDPSISTSLSSNRVSALFESRDGRLWIGTEGSGLDVFSPETENFEHLCLDFDETGSGEPSRVVDIFEHSSGEIWIGTLGGAFRYNPREGHTVAFSETNGRAAIFSIFEDQNGRIWLGGEKGLERFDPETGESVVQFFGSVRSVIGDAKGGLWVGTVDHGLFHIDSATSFVARHISLELNGKRIHDLLRDEQSQLWIGTEQGLLRYDPESLEVVIFRHDPLDPNSLSYDNVLDVFLDSSGILWVATWGGGVCKLDVRATWLRRLRRRALGFEGVGGQGEVMSMIEDRTGSLWVGTWDGGLHRLDPGSDQFVTFRADPTGIQGPTSDSIVAFLEDRRGRLWIGTRAGGVNRYEGATGRFVAYPQYDDPRAPGHLIHAIFEDAEGMLWLGTSRGGLVRFDPETSSFRHFRHDPNDSSSIGSNDVWAVIEGEHGRLWLATSGGLAVYDQSSDHFVMHRHIPGDPESLPNNRTNCLLRDRNGVIWAGTESGLVFTDGEGEAPRFKRAGNNGGLLTTRIQSIIEDDVGMLWVGTDRGLLRLDPGTGISRTFSAVTGAQKSYFANSVTRRHDGRLYFGGIGGITVVDPATVPRILGPPRIVLTDFLVLNQPQRPAAPGHISPLKKPIHRCTEVSLRYSQFPLAFDFAALQYSDPEQHRFEYRLEGLDADWVLTDAKNRRATYSRLEPGSYTFNVRGANSDGIWSDVSTSVRLMVRPPWWMTSWARGLALLIVVGLILVWHRVRMVRVERQALKLKDQVRERTAELVEANRQLELIARADPLTGLPNRRGFLDRAEQELMAIRRTKRPLVVCMADIDHFKEVNDNHGHEAGDYVLKSVAELFRSSVRDRDVVARWGGEEFVLLLPETDAGGAERLAEKIRKRVVAVPVIIGDRRIDLSVTIGVAELCGDEDLEATIARADRALYRGKRTGRNRVVVDE